jgi:hypothetical protein
MTGMHAAGHLDLGDTGITGVAALGGEAVDRASVGQDAGGQQGADAAMLGECGALLEDRRAEPAVEICEFAVELADVVQQVVGQRWGRPRAGS